MPTVSVCLPVYNGAVLVVDAIRSILCQTITDLELIVVDDASDDDTVRRVESIRDERLRLIANPSRLGIPANWNRSIEHATGTYLCVFHQDDIMHPANLARKLAVLQSDESIQWIHSAVSTESDGAPTEFSRSWLEPCSHDFVMEGHAYLRQLALHGNRVCAPSVIARRSAVVEAGSFQTALTFASDYELWMRLCLFGRVAYLEQPLVTYRWHAANASHGFAGVTGIEEARNAARSALGWARGRPDAPADIQFLGEVAEVTFQLRSWLEGARSQPARAPDSAPRPPSTVP